MAIIFIYDVYMSLLEQDHQEKTGVQEPYKMYENTTRCIKTLLFCYVQERYKNATQLEFEFKLNITTPNSSTYLSSTYPSYNIWAPTPPSSKLRLLVARADKQLSMIRPTGIKGCQLSIIQPTWVKDCQLSTIWVRNWVMWLSFQSTFDDLCGRWSVWPITCDLYGLWPV